MKSVGGETGLSDLLARCRVEPGHAVDLRRFDPRPPVPDGLDKHAGDLLIERAVRQLSAFQELLYANASRSFLVVVQAMDAAGKDGTIKYALSGVNPQGVTVTAFKAPGPEELAHDFLWTASRAAPAKGMIGVFNRSHYEEVLIARVHPEILARQRLPAAITGRAGFWDDRLEDIAAFERRLAREGTCILKLFLHVSRDEQKRRFFARLDEPDKGWKFDPGDIAERRAWAEYMSAYEAALAATATVEAPWFVIPADRKWLMRLLVIEAMVEALASLDLKPVPVSPEQDRRFAEARRMLDEET